MTFLTDEQSVHDAEPVELYDFLGPNATHYRYTSNGFDVVFQSETYTAVPMEASSISGAIDGSQTALDVRISRTTQLVLDYAFDVSPRSLSVTVYRLHYGTGTFRRWWGGKVTGMSVQGDVCLIRVPSLLADALETNIPTAYYQTLCNHVLYDSRCKILSTDFDVATTVSVISSDRIEITVASDGGNPDQWFRAGEIVRDSDGERRMIADHTGNVLTIEWPFKTLAVSNAVTLFAGCDHSFQTCVDKFANPDNFGGHPHIPTVNPWASFLGVKAQPNQGLQSAQGSVSQVLSGGTRLIIFFGTTTLPPSGQFDGGTAIKINPPQAGIPQDIITAERTSAGTGVLDVLLTSALLGVQVGDTVRLQK